MAPATTTAGKSSAPHRPTSNIRLFLWGLALALLSAVYPRLPAYLPSSVSTHLPFLTPSLKHPAAQPWKKLQRYQHQIPIAANHDPFDLEGQHEERSLRMGSKEGKKQKENEMRKIRDEIEKRTERAGVENKVHEDLPVYYLQADSAKASSSLMKSISDEILDVVQPKSVVFLSAVDSSATHVQVHTASSFVSSASNYAVHGNPSLARHLLTTFAHAAPNSVLALPSPNDRLPDDVSIVYEALFGRSGARVDVVLVGVPMPSSNKDKAKAWDAEEIYDVGSALLRTRREEDDVVIIAVGGDLRPGKNPSSSFPTLLHDVLAHHTAHPRLSSLSSLYAGASGTKPTRRIRRAHIGLYAAIGAAGEGEGEALDGDEGKVWRFGHLPMRKAVDDDRQ